MNEREPPGAPPEDPRCAKRSGLTLKEVREKAGVGKETVRKALHGKRVAHETARAIASVLGEGLVEGEVRGIEEELKARLRANL